MYTQTDLQMHLPFTTKQYLIKFELQYKQQIYLFIYLYTYTTFKGTQHCQASALTDNQACSHEK